MQESPAPSTVIVFGWVYKENPGKCRVQVSVLLISQQQRCKSSDLVHLCLVPCSAVLVCLTERHVDEFSNKSPQTCVTHPRGISTSGTVLLGNAFPHGFSF